jgi:hypothetical protein
MFYKCYKFNRKITIKAEDLRQSSCAYMFFNCTSLTNVPLFTSDSKKIGDYCFNSVFCGCTSMTNTPNIIGTMNQGSDACYYRAFKDCTSLTTTFESLTAT